MLTAAALVGLGAAALELGCAYATERARVRRRRSARSRAWRTRSPTTPPTSTAPGSSSRKAAWSLDTGEGRGRELAAMAFAFAVETAARGDLRRSARPRRLRLHARVRRAALLPPGPRLAPGLGRRRRRPTAAPPPPATPPMRRCRCERASREWRADGLLWDDALRGAPRGGAGVPRRAPPAGARGRSSTGRGTAHDDGFVRALGERNWIAPEWPRDGFDGSSRGPCTSSTEELTRADAPIFAVDHLDDGGPRRSAPSGSERAAGGDPPEGRAG